MGKLSKAVEDQLFRENPEMRAKGLRPEVVWVPDTDSPEFREELRQQVTAISQSPGEAEIIEWIEKVADWPKD